MALDQSDLIFNAKCKCGNPMAQTNTHCSLKCHNEEKEVKEHG